MANQGAKKRKEENKKHMAMLLQLIIACNVIYVIVRMLIFHSTFTWKHWIGLIVTSAAYGIPYQQLANMAKPSYSDAGELLDGGYDMSTTGVCGYLHDVIYITSFVQLMSILSGKFWWTYLVLFLFYSAGVGTLNMLEGGYTLEQDIKTSKIPAFGAYKVSGLLRGLFGSSEDGVEDDKSRKKREKMEKKASRGKFMKTRNR